VVENHRSAVQSLEDLVPQVRVIACIDLYAMDRGIQNLVLGVLGQFLEEFFV